MAGGRRKVSFSREEKRQKVKSRSLSLRKDLYSPFYMPKGAGYMSRERVSSCMLNRCAEENLFHAVGPSITVGCMIACVLVCPVLCLPMQVAGAMNVFDALVHACVKGSPNYSGGQPARWKWPDT
jgi:hypothetical protein